LLAIALHPLAFLLGHLVTWLYPISPDVAVELQAMQGLFDQAPNVWMILMVLSATPAICEELAFRGFILSGMRRVGHKWLAILVTSVFFGAAHSMIQQSMTACAIGMILGYIAIQTGSLLPAILFHLVHNSMSILVSLTSDTLPSILLQYPVLTWFVTMSEQGVSYEWPTLVLSATLSVYLLRWFGDQHYEHTREESRQEALDRQKATDRAPILA